jgi:vacuolar-type H+-ATPase subunit C/Vma6
MELALDQWHYYETHQALRGEAGESPLAYAMALDADLTNLLTVLRFTHDPREREVLRDRWGSDEIGRLFIKAGRLPVVALVSAGKGDGVASVVESFAGTPYESALRAGLEAYVRSNRLSDIEKHLRHYRLGQLAWLIQKDPLGIGVVPGYIALKVCEVGNIRWIARGLNLDLKAEAIRAGLETVL